MTETHQPLPSYEPSSFGDLINEVQLALSANKLAMQKDIQPRAVEDENQNSNGTKCELTNDIPIEKEISDGTRTSTTWDNDDCISKCVTPLVNMSKDVQSNNEHQPTDSNGDLGHLELLNEHAISKNAHDVESEHFFGSNVLQAQLEHGDNNGTNLFSSNKTPKMESSMDIATKLPNVGVDSSPANGTYTHLLSKSEDGIIHETDIQNGVASSSVKAVSSSANSFPRPKTAPKPPALPAKPPKFVRPAVSMSNSAPPVPKRPDSNAVDQNPSPPVPAEEHKAPMDTSLEKATSISPSAITKAETKGSSIFKKSSFPAQVSRFFREISHPKKEKGLSSKSGSKTELCDDVPSTEFQINRLSHLTAERPRNKHKRPPSQAFLKEMAVVITEPEVPTKDSTTATASKVVPIVPVTSTASPKMRFRDNDVTEDCSKCEFVRKEDFDQLLAAFEAFRRDTAKRLRELENRIFETDPKQDL